MAAGPAKVRFLQDMAERFEKDGNIAESVQSAENALFLRRSLPSEEQALFPDTLSKQAQELVMKCNAVGVSYFQKQLFEPATLLLEKALFLTEDNATTNCFGAMEHDRLRLRAATYNNLGCMEKRRENYNGALAHLQESIEIETVVDPDVGASASTYMNLCTVLNKVGRHTQAANAAERSIRQLISQVQHHNKDPTQAAFCQQLMMSYYNFGVSLEFAGRPGDVARAHEAYVGTLRAGVKFAGGPSKMPAELASIYQAAERAVARVEAEQPSVLSGGASLSASVPALPNIQQGASGGALVSTGLSPAQIAALRAGSVPSTPSSVSFTPQPPLGKGGAGARMPPEGRGIRTAEASTRSHNRKDDAINRHAARIQAKAERKKQNEERAQLALKKARVAHIKEKEERERREQEQVAKQLEASAKEMNERSEAHMRADKMRELRFKATQVQKVFRGFLARDLIRDMKVAVVKLQSVVRSHLCRVRLREEKKNAEQRARDAAILKVKTDACVIIQRRLRRFFNRLRIIREYRSRQLRRAHSAKRIQHVYREYRVRKEQRILDQLVAEQKAEEARLKGLHDAARKIQNMFRAFKSRRFMRVVRKEQARRNEAATKIQAAMRGCLTRAWFRHYRLYRRQQELSTAANLRAISRIQRSWRQAIARRLRRRLALEKRHKEHQKKLFVSARRIQCAWRSYDARQIAKERRRRVQRRHEAASAIQRRWKVFLCRREYIWHRDEARKMRSLRRLQGWWRAMIVRKKHVETARYHAALLRAERERTVRTACAITLQTLLRWCGSMQATAARSVTYQRNLTAALAVQRLARGYTARKDANTTKRMAYLVDLKTKHDTKVNAAACTIQRPVRQFLAREKVNRLRREKYAAIRIQSVWRMHRARKILRQKKRDKRLVVEEAAARKIQKSVRLFFKRQELRRLDEYYTARRRHKLWEQRRVEASITIQAAWRGFATRQATAAARARMLQRTIDAIRIQRAYRTHLFRMSVAREMLRRKRQRSRRHTAALQLQCFWRRILATEYVALLRERRFHQTVAVICMQCAWRRYVAKRELERRLAKRKSVRQLSAMQHDAYTTGCTAIQTHLRSLQDRRERLVLLEASLAKQLRDRQNADAERRYTSATKIQANYRGHYERVYARGLLKEKREKERKERAIFVKKTTMASRIQRGWRCHRARLRVAELRLQKNLREIEEQVERETAADPHDVIKQMFWAHEASQKRDLRAERVQRHDKQNKAATHITRIVRGFLARRRCVRLRASREEQAAATAIQTGWRQHQKIQEHGRERIRNRSATKIQSIVRMFLAKRVWRRRKRVLVQAKNVQVATDEQRDEAATRVQAWYRGELARHDTKKLRLVQKERKDATKKYEAARMIQKHYRAHLAVIRVKKLKKAAEARRRRDKRRSGEGNANDDDDAVLPGALPPVAPPRRPASGGGTAAIRAQGRPSNASSSSLIDDGVLRDEEEEEEDAVPKPPPRAPTKPSAEARGDRPRSRSGSVTGTDN